MKSLTSFPELTTDRLLLRKLEQSDFENIIFLRSDREVNRLVKRPKAENKEQALSFIQKVQKQAEEGKSYYWCITEKNSEEMIGSISLWNFSEDMKTAEVGYDLKPAFHKRGIMNEAMKAVLEFGFGKMKFQKIEAFTHWKNESSKNLLLRNGFETVPERNDPDDDNNRIFVLKAFSNLN